MFRAHRIVLVIACIAGLGGLLFGYDTGVISGALLFVKPQFHLSAAGAGLVTGAVLIGAMIGALVAGAYADRFGRRNANIVSGVIFAVAAIGTALVPVGETWLLVVARIVVGIGIGGNSVAAPMYIAEVAPRKLRGAMVSLYQLAITMGIFVSYLVDAALAGTGDDAWRWMFALAFIPALALTLGMMFLPRSPRWLVKRGRHEEARTVLGRVGVDEGSTVDAEIDLIVQDLKSTQSGKWRELLAPTIRKAAFLAVMIMFIQQFTGINTIIYYAPFIFKAAGFESNVVSLLATSGIGLTNMLATFIAIALIDRLGRRKLLLLGLTGMTLSLILLGAAFMHMGQGAHPHPAAAKTAGLSQPMTHSSGGAGLSPHAMQVQHAADQQGEAPADGLEAAGQTPAADQGINPLGVATICCLVGYIICFAFSLGPIGWVLVSEIFPNNMRSRGVALGTAANWGANFVVAQTFLVMIAALGASMTFWFYALTGIISLLLIWSLVPETKGHTLEEIERRWLRGGEKLR